MKRTASFAGALTALAVLLAGCGTPAITVKGQDALQPDIHRVREAAAGHSKSALVTAIAKLYAKTRTEYHDKQLTADRAAQIDAAAQRLLNDFNAVAPKPTPSTPAPSTSAPPVTPSTEPPPTTSSPTAPPTTSAPPSTSPPATSPTATSSGGLLGGA